MHTTTSTLFAYFRFRTFFGCPADEHTAAMTSFNIVATIVWVSWGTRKSSINLYSFKISLERSESVNVVKC